MTTAAGDGHGTVASQMWLSAQEKESFARPTLYVEGGHFDLVLNPIAMRRLVQYLEDE